MYIRALVISSMLAASANAQTPTEQRLKSRTEVSNPVPPSDQPPPPVLVVRAGTKIPLQLRQPVSTKGAQTGDPIYAQTTFPIVMDGTMVIPAGTWVQGVVDSVKRAGRIKGTAEMQFH